MYWIDRLWMWFTRAAQFWLVETLLLYFGACIVAGKPVGPREFVNFTYHVMQWQPGAPVNAAASGGPRIFLDRQ